MVDDATWRHRIYRSFADTGAPPDDVPSDVLRRLHDTHAVVLHDDRSVRMALPFSAVETSHVVRGDQRSWFANCAWDSLAIPAALGVDAGIEATYVDSGEPVDLAVRDGRLTHTDGYLHFAVPARHWWDDIVET